jgi:membrane associated rhomboid family serine protease
MPRAVSELVEQLLHQIALTAPDPWFPATYARSANMPRDRLDVPLALLRAAGLVRLSNGIPGGDDGYVLTYRGLQAMKRTQDQLWPGEAEPGAPPGTPLAVPVDPAVADRAEVLRQALDDPAPQWVTRGLLLANLVVFGLGLWLAQQRQVAPEYLHPYGAPHVIKGPLVLDILRETGAARAVDVIRGEWWRLLTCCFVHIGWIHLAINLISLALVGPMLERMWGHVRFLLLYLIAGLGGSCIGLIEAVEKGAQQAMLAGASGAIWGILASVAIWLVLNRRALPRAIGRSLVANLVFVAGLNVALTFLIPQISKGAHFGGGAVGLLAALALHYQRFGHGWVRGLATAGVVAVLLLCLVVLREADRLSPAWKALIHEEEQRAAKNDYLDEAKRLDEDSSRFFRKEVKPLFDNYRPARRPAAEVEKALAGLARDRGELDRAAERLAEAGRPRSVEVEETRQAGEQYLRAKARFFEMTEDYLKQAKWDDNDWKWKEQEIERLGKEWRERLERK